MENVEEKWRDRRVFSVNLCFFKAMSTGVPYIGSKISLITTSDIRYEGPLAQTGCVVDKELQFALFALTAIAKPDIFERDRVVMYDSEIQKKIKTSNMFPVLHLPGS